MHETLQIGSAQHNQHIFAAILGVLRQSRTQHAIWSNMHAVERQISKDAESDKCLGRIATDWATAVRKKKRIEIREKARIQIRIGVLHVNRKYVI